MSKTNAVHMPRGASGHQVLHDVRRLPQYERERQSGSHVQVQFSGGQRCTVPDHRQPLSPGVRKSIMLVLIAVGAIITGACAFLGTLQSLP